MSSRSLASSVSAFNYDSQERRGRDREERPEVSSDGKSILIQGEDGEMVRLYQVSSQVLFQVLFQVSFQVLFQVSFVFSQNGEIMILLSQVSLSFFQPSSLSYIIIISQVRCQIVSTKTKESLWKVTTHSSLPCSF